jgi:YD repeat-containing protein
LVISQTLSGDDQIEVVFGDGTECNLFVNYVDVAGQRVQAEGGAAIIDKGAEDEAFDGLNVIAGQQGIYWNAALRFVVGDKAYAACYDENGNMTWRLRDGVAYEQGWDYENRLVSVLNHAEDWRVDYTYDGNGALVQKEDDVGVTVYVGGLYEDFEMASAGPGIDDDFGDGDDDGWRPTGGTWAVESGVYSGQDSGSQASLWNLSMTEGRFGAGVESQSSGGQYTNGFLVFDYVDPRFGLPKHATASTRGCTWARTSGPSASG